MLIKDYTAQQRPVANTRRRNPCGQWNTTSGDAAQRLRVDCCLARVRELLDAGRTLEAERFKHNYSPAYVPTRPDRWLARIHAIEAAPPHLYDREPRFLRDMARRCVDGYAPSERQAAWIRKIERRLRS